MTLSQPTSYNRFVVKAYEHTGLASEVKSGWAKVEQKVALKGLKTLVAAQLIDGNVLPVGSTIYVKEEYLHNNCKTKHKNDSLKDEFHLIPFDQVEYVDPAVPNQ